MKVIQLAYFQKTTELMFDWLSFLSDRYPVAMITKSGKPMYR